MVKHSKNRHENYDSLFRAFTSSLNIKGQKFGPSNKPYFGMSDGNNGVQWNISIYTKLSTYADDKRFQMGVNLEGMKYDGWPISRFILSEIKEPKIQEISANLNKPDNIYIRFTRDAWQVQSRPCIDEKYIGGSEPSFSQISPDQWLRILSEALDCLDREKNFLGRAKQRVTRKKKSENGEQLCDMEVTPHLTIWTPLILSENMQRTIAETISELKPVYDWVKNTSQS